MAVELPPYPAILNVSGNNTLNGTIRSGGGGGAYNIGSNSGTLTIANNLNMSANSDRGYVFTGNGNFTVNGNVTGSGSNVSVEIMKAGNGTLTLNGAANTHIGFMDIEAGTVALGSAAGISFVPATDLGVVPQVVVSSGATFDVSAVPGGFTLPSRLPVTAS